MNAGMSIVINREAHGIERYPHMREVATESYLIRASMLAYWTRMVRAQIVRVVIRYVCEGGLTPRSPSTTNLYRTYTPTFKGHELGLDPNKATWILLSQRDGRSPTADCTAKCSRITLMDVARNYNRENQVF